MGLKKRTAGRPRFVVVTRPTWLEEVLGRHGTRGQAEFYLKTRGQSLGDLEEAHQRFEAGLGAVLRALPEDQPQVRVRRDQLDRFLFRPADTVIVVGQDGLVPNVAKYLRGQRTIGVNPDPARYDGVLCRHEPSHLPALLGYLRSGEGPYRLEERPLAEAEREDGQRVRALNEVYVGHQSHQSARYLLRTTEGEERHSSSGLICATGTGATGWARSIARPLGLEPTLPGPEDPRLAWLVREPFPSVYTGTRLSHGFLGPGDELVVVSGMGEGGVIFADGIEADRVEFVTGQTVRLRLADTALRLVVPADGSEGVPPAERRGEPAATVTQTTTVSAPRRRRRRR